MDVNGAIEHAPCGSRLHMGDDRMHYFYRFIADERRAEDLFAIYVYDEAIESEFVAPFDRARDLTHAQRDCACAQPAR